MTNSFGLTQQFNLTEHYRIRELCSCIKLSQSRAYSLLMQHKTLAKSNLVGRARLADEIRSEMSSLLNSFDAYQEIQKQARNGIEGSIYSSYHSTQHNIRTLARMLAEKLNSIPSLP